MKEIGFWDYTCPHHGSLERYEQAAWDLLLEDMLSGGFNSLVLGIKWLTTPGIRKAGRPIVEAADLRSYS